MDIMLPPGLHFSFILGVVINTRQYTDSTRMLAMQNPLQENSIKRLSGVCSRLRFSTISPSTMSAILLQIC